VTVTIERVQEEWVERLWQGPYGVTTYPQPRGAVIAVPRSSSRLKLVVAFAAGRTERVPLPQVDGGSLHENELDNARAALAGSGCVACRWDRLEFAVRADRAASLAQATDLSRAVGKAVAISAAGDDDRSDSVTSAVQYVIGMLNRYAVPKAECVRVRTTVRQVGLLRRRQVQTSEFWVVGAGWPVVVGTELVVVERDGRGVWLVPDRPAGGLGRLVVEPPALQAFREFRDPQALLQACYALLSASGIH
jgi:hypothetical protein